MINALRNIFAHHGGNKASTEAAAYQLSGQAIIAYYHGYTCRSMSLGKNPSLPFSLSIDFKRDEPLVNSLLQFTDNPVLYAACTGEQKLNCLDVAPRLLLVLQAGTVAREIRLKGRQAMVRDTRPEIDPEDHQPLQNVSAFLRHIKPHLNDPLQDALGDLILMFKISQVWRAVDALAAACMKNKACALEQTAIEKVLAESGYMRFIGAI